MYSLYICTNFLKTMEKIFDNTADAFVLKSDTELDRAYFLFRMIASEPLVKIGTAVTNFALKIHLPVEGLIRATVFDHFCGGGSRPAGIVRTRSTQALRLEDQGQRRAGNPPAGAAHPASQQGSLRVAKCGGRRDCLRDQSSGRPQDGWHHGSHSRH